MLVKKYFLWVVKRFYEAETHGEKIAFAALFKGIFECPLFFALSTFLGKWWIFIGIFSTVLFFGILPCWGLFFSKIEKRYKKIGIFAWIGAGILGVITGWFLLISLLKAFLLIIFGMLK